MARGLKEKIDELLLLLRTEYSDRFEEINELVGKIENIKATPENIDEKMFLNDLNDELLDLNEGNMELQNRLTAFINEYLLDVEFDFEILDEEEIPLIPFDDCLTLTISGDLDFDEEHPYYLDDYFYAELLQHYIELEEYQKCAELKNTRRKFLE